MKAIEELDSLHPSGPTLISVGVFDGIHRGHQHLLGRLKAEAESKGFRTAVVTFRNHPREVLRPGERVPRLTTIEDRIHLLDKFGIDLVAPLTFDMELSQVRARDFVALLQDKLEMQGLVVGPDFALGHKREGTIPVLRELGAEMGFTVTDVERLDLGGLPARSSAIRSAAADGDMASAALLLGRPFTLPGHVQHGEGRGRGLGFPTANLEIHPDLLLPPDGVYATWLKIADVYHPSATNIGLRPTFGPGQRTVETHVMDFDGDLYETDVRLAFAVRLRDELRFDTPDALVDRMHQDVVEARAALASAAGLLADAERWA